VPAPKEDLLERIQLRLDESSDGIAERVTDLPAADLVDLVNQLTRAEAPHRSRFSTSPVAAPVTWVARTLIDYTMAASRALIESAFTKTPFLQEVPVAAKLAAHPSVTSSCVPAG
jgi:hypothetical protein